MEVACPNRVRFFRWLIVTGLSLGVVVTLFCFDPSQHAFYPRCVLHQTTGLLCPGCGGLRAMHQLLHGHIAAAFSLNPFLVISAPILLLFCARYVAGFNRNRRMQFMLSPRWLWVWIACAF